MVSLDPTCINIDAVGAFQFLFKHGLSYCCHIRVIGFMLISNLMSDFGIAFMLNHTIDLKLATEFMVWDFPATVQVWVWIFCSHSQPELPKPTVLE